MKHIPLSPATIMLGALLLTLLGWGFKSYEAARLERVTTEVHRTQERLRQIGQLRRLWDAKGIQAKLRRIQGSIPGAKNRMFTLKRRSLELKAVDLEGRELNRLLGKLGALPLQVKRLAILRDKDRYELECKCIW
jgi:hypothetical protein